MKEPDINDPDFFEPEKPQSELEMLWNGLRMQKGDHDDLELNPENDVNYVFSIGIALSEREMNELWDIERARDEAERDMENEINF